MCYTVAIMTKPSASSVVFDQLGIDALCALIHDGNTLLSIADAFGVSRSVLFYWIEDPANPERSARAAEARRLAASAWDERAERDLKKATNFLEVQKARELAHHYRWRAKCIAPRDFGERKETPAAPDKEVVLTIKGGLPET